MDGFPPFHGRCAPCQGQPALDTPLAAEGPRAPPSALGRAPEGQGEVAGLVGDPALEHEPGIAEGFGDRLALELAGDLGVELLAGLERELEVQAGQAQASTTTPGASR